MTKKEAERIAKQHLAEALAPYDFKYTPRSFGFSRRPDGADYMQQITFAVADYNPMQRLTLSASIRIDPVEEVKAPLLWGEHPKEDPWTLTFTTPSGYFAGEQYHEFDCEEAAELVEALQEVEQDYLPRMIEHLECYAGDWRTLLADAETERDGVRFLRGDDVQIAQSLTLLQWMIEPAGLEDRIAKHRAEFAEYVPEARQPYEDVVDFVQSQGRAGPGGQHG